VTVPHARERYGVVIDEGHLAVDEVATRALRTARRTAARNGGPLPADLSGVE
jgi:hypothetical protein